MSREYVREYAAVMLSYASGKTIQYRRRYCKPGTELPEGAWGDHPEIPAWDWGNFEYRVKPEPMELWIWVKEGKQSTVADNDNATECKFMSDKGWARKKFREVIE